MPSSHSRHSRATWWHTTAERSQSVGLPSPAYLFYLRVNTLQDSHVHIIGLATVQYWHPSAALLLFFAHLVCRERCCALLLVFGICGACGRALTIQVSARTCLKTWWTPACTRRSRGAERQCVRPDPDEGSMAFEWGDRCSTDVSLQLLACRACPQFNKNCNACTSAQRQHNACTPA